MWVLALAIVAFGLGFVSGRQDVKQDWERDKVKKEFQRQQLVNKIKELEKQIN